MENTMEIENGRLTLEEFSALELSELHVMRRVSLESVWGLLEHCPVVRLAQGTMLFEKGQSNQIMYFVLEGSLGVYLDGMTEPVALLERGQTVGEISVIDDSPATAFVCAESPSRLLAVDEDTFWRLVEYSHEFAANLLTLLAQRMRANNSKLTEGRKLTKKLKHEATVDALTGLRNRRWLEDNLQRLVQRHRFGKRDLSVLMLDIDHFKRFNDDYGHAAGDRVLACVAKVAMSRLRPTDRAARYGGEEFVVILPDTPNEGSLIAAERLRNWVLKTQVKYDGSDLPPITISIGVATLSGDETADVLLGRADSALYRAKENGRNRVEI